MKIGILGGGQLGRMLTLAGVPLGLDVAIFSSEDSPPCGIFSSYTRGDFSDRAAVQRFASGCDVVTAEFENIPQETLKAAAEETTLYPATEIFKTASDRLLEKQLAEKLGIPIPRYIAVDSLEELKTASKSLPNALVKARSLGYDGKSQARIEPGADLNAAWESVGKRPSLLEEFFPFEFEVSLLSVRNVHGEVAFYQISRNTHLRGILTRSVVIPGLLPELQKQAESYARMILEGVNYVGVLAIEFFVRDGNLYFNEMAPRVHNTGHWTIEGALTSQFENHMRAIAGLPLGSPEARAECEMLNIIGQEPEISSVISVRDAHLHLYGKSPRAGRKIGHITVVGTTESGLLEKLRNEY